MAFSAIFLFVSKNGNFLDFKYFIQLSFLKLQPQTTLIQKDHSKCIDWKMMKSETLCFEIFEILSMYFRTCQKVPIHFFPPRFDIKFCWEWQNHRVLLSSVLHSFAFIPPHVISQTFLCEVWVVVDVVCSFFYSSPWNTCRDRLDSYHLFFSLCFPFMKIVFLRSTRKWIENLITLFFARRGDLLQLWGNIRETFSLLRKFRILILVHKFRMFEHPKTKHRLTAASQIQQNISSTFPLRMIAIIWRVSKKPTLKPI